MVRRPSALALGTATVVTLVVPPLAWFDIALPGRALLAVLFVVLVPGVPAVLALPLGDGRVQTVLAPALSISVSLLVGSVQVLNDAWHPTVAVTITAAVGLILTPWAVRRERSRDAPEPVSPRPDPRTSGLREHVVPGAGVRWCGLLGVALALASWWWATRRVDTAGVHDKGVFAVAPVQYWLALAVLAGVFAWQLLRPHVDHVVLAATSAATALCCFGFVNVADGAGSVGAGWVYVGFVDYVGRTGTLAEGIDARFSWPGYLSGMAQLVSVAGLRDASTLMILAPVVFAVLSLPAVWLIARLVTGSARYAWVGVLVALVANWYQQDYLSAQATAYVLYVSVLAVMLWTFYAAEIPVIGGRSRSRWLRAAERVPSRPRVNGVELSPVTMLLLEGLLTLLVAALVVSHQLTPMTLVSALLWFALTGCTRMRTLWISAAALFIGWFVYGAVAYWRGHLFDLLGDVGQVGQSLSGGTTERLIGQEVYRQFLLYRIGWTGLLLVAGAAGWWQIRRRRDAPLLAGLALAPFGLVAVQSYGGEIVIRCVLYAGPVLAALAALAALGIARLAAVSVRLSIPRLVTRLSAVSAVGVALLMLTVTRGLNLSFEHVTAGQVEAARHLLATAPPGSSIGIVGAVGPLPVGGLGEVYTVSLAPYGCPATREDCLFAVLGNDGGKGPDYIFITSGMDAQASLQIGRPPGWTKVLIDRALSSGGYQVIERSDDVTVLVAVSRPGPTSDTSGELGADSGRVGVTNRAGAR